MIQGFGPPIQKQVPESMGGGGAEKEESPNEKPNIPQPKRFVIDPKNPIYKHGDLNQPGEKGRAVNIDKKV